MVTIFSTPKPFTGLNKIIQWNAIKSWKNLGEDYEIILLGNDKGVKEICDELDLIHLPDINTNNLNTPLLDSVFKKAEKRSSKDFMMYINSDIIICNDIVSKISSFNFESFIVTGRRWDLDVKSEINYENDNWKKDLLLLNQRKGVLHDYSGKDYFIYKKGTISMLPFSVGRPYWDDWLLYHARSKKYPIIDASLSIKIVHQNHDYSHSKYSVKKRVMGPEYQENVKLLKSFSNIISMRESDWILKDSQLIRPNGINKILNFLSYFYLWRFFLGIKRLVHYFFVKFSENRA